MSGTSLDGLDLCAAEFERSGDRWTYQIRAFETISYRATLWPKRLTEAYTHRGTLRDQVSRDFAAWCQDQWLAFGERHHFGTHAIAHHGHTVEHDPARGITVQIGHEASVFAQSPIPVVGDFRSGSVARSGQGAPLVPLADRDLFADYAVCVNLGGFSNASWTDAGGLRRAGDLGPCNGLLNPLAGELNLEYDPEGQHASTGTVRHNESLTNLEYYAAPFPKSLGREWMEREFWPAFNSARPPRTEDALATASAHIAWSIVHGLKTANAPQGKTLLSGGGARSTHLVNQLRHIAPEWKWTVAPDSILESKEALAFAYLGLLRLRNEPNVLASYAGGQNDGCDGTVFGKCDQT